MINRFIKDIKKYYKYALYSARSELKSEVANSYLNWLWWVLDPICFMLIYTFIFGVVFNGSEPYFPIYIFIGLSMWDFFNRTMTNSVRMVKNNKAIVSKVYIPKFVLLIVKMCVNGFKMFISFAVVAGMMVFYRVPVSIHIFYAIPILIILTIFTFGCGAILMHFGVFVEDLSNVVAIGLRLLFYVTGIFYNIATRLPAPYGEAILKLNPLAYLLDALRKSVLYASVPGRKLLLLYFVIGLVISYLGIRTIYKNENSYVKVI